MTKKPEKKVRYTFEYVEKRAAQFPDRKSMLEADPVAFRKMNKRGWGPKLFPNDTSIRQEFDLDKVSHIALRHETRTEFARKDERAYRWAQVNGHLDAVCSHMKWAYKYRSDEEVLETARSYNSPGEFQKHDSQTYKVALARGLLEKACAHMTGGRTQWTREMIVEEIAKYETLNDFMTYSNAAYRAAYRLDDYEDLVRNLSKAYRSHTDEDLITIAKEYRTIADLQRDDCSTYNTILKRGLSNQAFEHMERLGFDRNQPHNVYYIRYDTEYGPLYKIGITKFADAMKRFEREDTSRITVLKVWPHKTGTDALDAEKKILDRHSAKSYNGPKVLNHSGGSEFFTEDVLNLDPQNTYSGATGSFTP